MTLIDNETIDVHTPTEIVTYKLISNTYYESSRIENSNAAHNFRCYTREEIEKLPSNFDYVTPIYETMAIGAILVILYSAYYLLIRPFFRKI